jgi:hypothetical protein
MLLDIFKVLICNFLLLLYQVSSLSTTLHLKVSSLLGVEGKGAEGEYVFLNIIMFDFQCIVDFFDKI